MNVQAENARVEGNGGVPPGTNHAVTTVLGTLCRSSFEEPIILDGVKISPVGELGTQTYDVFFYSYLPV